MKITNRPKFDYDSPKFYKTIEQLAKRGLTNKGIARGLVQEYGKNIHPKYFSALKNEKDEDGKYTVRAINIRKALEKGRLEINWLVRMAYLQYALGGRIIKSTETLYIDYGTENQRIIKVSEFEREMPPNIRLLNKWLSMFDDEWQNSTSQISPPKIQNLIFKI